MYPQAHLPLTDQPWGVAGVRREARGAFADSRYFYVDPTNTTFQATDLGNSGEDPEHPLLTIQQAITNARAYQGDTIYVLENEGWKYGRGVDLTIRESVTIPVDKPGLHLVGVGRGSMGVYWRPALTGGTCLTINALDTEVEGFAFTGMGLANANGILVNWVQIGLVGPSGENVIIHDCVFDEDIDTAIRLIYSYYAHIYNNHFQECGAYGIFCDAGDTASQYAHIHDNWFNNCAVAAALHLLDHSLINHNWIYNLDAQNGVAATDEGIHTTGGGHNIVSDNYFSCILPVAAPGDYGDLNSAAATDAWIFNHCMNGNSITNP